VKDVVLEIVDEPSFVITNGALGSTRYCSALRLHLKPQRDDGDAGQTGLRVGRARHATLARGRGNDDDLYASVKLSRAGAAARVLDAAEHFGRTTWRVAPPGSRGASRRERWAPEVVRTLGVLPTLLDETPTSP